jgi:hypothetical protein
MVVLGIIRGESLQGFISFEQLEATGPRRAFHLELASPHPLLTLSATPGPRARK